MESSVAITGEGATIARLETIDDTCREGRDSQRGYSVHVSIDHRHRHKKDLTPIQLRLEYIISSAYWKPQYTLDIWPDGSRATLTLKAELESAHYTPPFTVSNMPVLFKQSAVDVYNKQLRLLERQDARRRGESLQLYPSQLMPESWSLTKLPTDNPTLRIIELHNVVPDLTGLERPRIEHLAARLESKHSTTLPAGTLAIFLDSRLISRTRMPNWNPDELITIPLGTEPSRNDAEAEPPSALALPPCSEATRCTPTEIAPSEDDHKVAHILLSMLDPVASRQRQTAPRGPHGADGGVSRPAPCQDINVHSTALEGSQYMEGSMGSPTEPRKPMASDNAAFGESEVAASRTPGPSNPQYGVTRRSSREAASYGLISEAGQDTHRLAQPGINKKTARRGDSSDERHRKKAKSSQQSDSTEACRSVSFLA